MKYQAIIFDLDGVLCSTDSYHYQAWKKVADKLGIYFDETINHRLRGVSRMESFEIILENYKGTLTEEEKIFYTNEKNEYYKDLLKKMSPTDLTPEVKNTLDALKAQGRKLAIGSSSKNAPFILSRLGLANFFDAVSDGTNITKSKPDPEVFLIASQRLAIPPQHCLVVEDAEAGLKAAIAAQMDCAGIGEASFSKLANYSLSSFHELLTIDK